MNMFKKVKADSVASYIAAQPAERQGPLKALDKLIRKTVPKLKAHFAYNMIGYGSFKYLNYKKETIHWPTVALAGQKNYYSIYICALENGKYIAEKYKKDLGKVSVGKSCIRFKKPEDLDPKGLAKVLKLAAKFPGLRPD